MTEQSARGDRRPMHSAPYGSWRSPVTARLIAEGGVGVGWPQSVGRSLYWVEQRPAEEGRYAVVRRGPDGTAADVTPPGRSARTLVHEYGGGAYVAFVSDGHGESVVFSDQADQRLYRQDLPAAADDGPPQWSPPRPLTVEPAIVRGHRHADGRVTPDGRRLIMVRERHEPGGEVLNELVSMPSDGSTRPQVIASGHDFYAAPRISRDGRRLAWICWDHPHMPWDGTGLWIAELAADGTVSAERRVAGGADESVLQPLWSPSGDLWFVSDRTGWWNLYAVSSVDLGRRDLHETCPEPCASITRAAEFARAPWVFGLQNYAFLTDGRLLAAFTEDDRDRLAVFEQPITDPGSPPRELDTRYSVFQSLTPLGAGAAMIAASLTEDWRVVTLDPDSATTVVVRRGRSQSIDPAYISPPEPIVFPTEGGVTAHANYYPPTNLDFRAPEGESPPLLVNVHGGPTSSRDTKLDLEVQYWTSRGVAVVDVNYGGSTGHGRAYRERLRGEWGVVDTVDAINAARCLIARGDADPERIGVRGASAGGYTTLNALTRFDFFSAGASHFGLADLEMFANGGTHKFESHYLESLVGPYPERSDVYRERSPIHFVDDIDCPVILLQGLEDTIVPPRQAEIMVTALRRKGLPFAYLTFPGEQHGFRKAKSIIRALESELSFYGLVWGFTPSDGLDPMQSEDLTGLTTGGTPAR